MKNRLLSLVTVLAMLVMSLAALASCGEDEETPAPGPAAPTHTHIYAEAWEYDVENHWQMTSCPEHLSERGNVGAHTYAEGSSVCSVCAYNNHVHTEAAEWSYNDNGHWHAYTCCPDIVVPPVPHTGYETDLVCDECGAHVHTFSEAWVKDETAHWHTATCEHTDHKVAYETHVGMGDCICDICGYEDHLAESEWLKDASGHWHDAACDHGGEKVDYSKHDYVNSKCKVCGYSKSVELPIIPA